MNSRLRSTLLIAMALIIGAAPLKAVDLTVFVGGVKPGAVTFQNVTTSLDSSPIYGVRLNTNFVPLFGMEHTLAFSSDYLFPRSLADVKEAKGFVYNSNLIINLPVKMVAVPYVTAGLGLLHQYGDANMPIGTKFAVNYGGGLKFPHLAGPLGLRFDVRGYRAGLFSSSVNLLEVSGGLLLSLGVK